MKVKKIARRLVKKHDLNHCTVEVVRTDGHVILRVTDEKGRGILNRDVGVASDTEQQVQRLTQQYTPRPSATVWPAAWPSVGRTGGCTAG